MCYLCLDNQVNVEPKWLLDKYGNGGKHATKSGIQCSNGVKKY